MTSKELDERIRLYYSDVGVTYSPLMNFRTKQLIRDCIEAVKERADAEPIVVADYQNNFGAGYATAVKKTEQYTKELLG